RHRRRERRARRGRGRAALAPGGRGGGGARAARRTVGRGGGREGRAARRRRPGRDPRPQRRAPRTLQGAEGGRGRRRAAPHRVRQSHPSIPALNPIAAPNIRRGMGRGRWTFVAGAVLATALALPGGALAATANPTSLDLGGVRVGTTSAPQTTTIT